MFRYCFFCILLIKVAELESKQFPDDFLFGVATSAYQIEGGWNAEGKGPNIWDDFTHSHPEDIADHSNGDVGPNSFEYYMDDIEAVKDMNMDFYRFSISWSRVLPNGDTSKVNENGIEYYNKIINKLLELNIEPMVTMYHWDLPLNFKSFGGFTNPAIIAYFKAYANLLFERFGDRVKYWITMNEPLMFCTDVGAANMNYSGVDEYLCGHNVLMAHALVYHLYKDTFYDRFKGYVGISLVSGFFYSTTNDAQLVDRALQFSFGWFANPIFSTHGNYPAVMIERIARNSKCEGFPNSRLPTFSKRWQQIIRGSADFLGFNYYTSRMVEPLDEPDGPIPSVSWDMAVNQTVNPAWKRGAAPWIYSVPQGLADVLRWIKKEYNNPVVYITENGWADIGELEDYGRKEYIHDHLEKALDVVVNGECNLKGYTAWSAIDNFEWTNGYTLKFGLYSVDMNSTRKERTPKSSAHFMKEVATNHRIPNIN